MFTKKKGSILPRPPSSRNTHHLDYTGHVLKGSTYQGKKKVEVIKGWLLLQFYFFVSSLCSPLMCERLKKSRKKSKESVVVPSNCVCLCVCFWIWSIESDSHSCFCPINLSLPYSFLVLASHFASCFLYIYSSACRVQCIPSTCQSLDLFFFFLFKTNYSPVYTIDIL